MATREELRACLRDLVDALPRCNHTDNCDSPATRAYPRHDRLQCEYHAELTGARGEMDDCAYAEPLRQALAMLAEHDHAE